jgi:hypothetical protein
VTDDQTAAKFLRGLTLGAIIGAVIAGSSFWTRRRRSAAGTEAPPTRRATDADDSPNHGR